MNLGTCSEEGRRRYCDGSEWQRRRQTGIGRGVDWWQLSNDRRGHQRRTADPQQHHPLHRPSNEWQCGRSHRVSHLPLHSTLRSVYVMSPIEILWLNMITSSPPALGLGLEKADKHIMQRPPPTKNALFTKEVIVDIAVYGTLMGALTLATFFIPFYVMYNGVIGINCNVVSDESIDCDPIYRSRASAYVALSLLILLHAFNCKHFRKPLWKINLWDNKPLFFTVVGGAALTIPTLYIPTFNTAVFKHKPIDIEWAVVVAALLVFIALGELYKLIKRKVLGEY